VAVLVAGAGLSLKYGGAHVVSLLSFVSCGQIFPQSGAGSAAGSVITLSLPRK
jgi:hypothetical protein